MKIIAPPLALIPKALFLAFGLALFIPFANQWWDIASDNRMPCRDCKLDFLSLYTGTHLLWSDREHLYDLETQKSFQLLHQPEQGDWVLPFMNPPITAVFLFPLRLFSFSVAYVLMTVINLGLLVASCVLLVRGFHLSHEATQWLLLFVLANTGTQVALLQGQTSFLLLFTLSAFFVEWKQSSELRAGMWWAVSAIKPQLSAVLLALLLIPVRKAFLTSAAISMAIIAAASFVMLGYKGTADFIELVQQAATGTDVLGVNAGRMHNLRALSMYIAPKEWIYMWLLASAALIVSVWVRESAQSKSGNLLVITLASVLLSPHLHTHDLTLLALPAASLLSQSPTGGVSKLAATATVFLAMLPLFALIFQDRLPPLVPLGLLMVLVTVWVAKDRSQEGRF